MGFLAISTHAMRAFILENRVTGEFLKHGCLRDKETAGRDTFQKRWLLQLPLTSWFQALGVNREFLHRIRKILLCL